MTLVIFQTRKDQNKSKFKEKDSTLSIRFNVLWNLYILFYISTEYLISISYGLQKRGMATIRSGRTNFAVFSYYKVST